VVVVVAQAVAEVLAVFLLAQQTLLQELHIQSQ
jgi:hypothetical protein